jgi:hypothetical protein
LSFAVNNKSGRDELGVTATKKVVWGWLLRAKTLTQINNVISLRLQILSNYRFVMPCTVLMCLPQLWPSVLSHIFIAGNRIKICNSH